MGTREPVTPHRKQKPGAKLPPPKRPNKRAEGPKVPLAPVSFGHGVNTAKFATEGEVKPPRY